MGNSNSIPLHVPSAKVAQSLSEVQRDAMYDEAYNDCKQQIHKAINNGSDCAFCNYFGPKYTKKMEEQGYKMEWISDDDYGGSKRYMVSWKVNEDE